MNLIAVGGGGMAAGETLPIDLELVRLTGRRRPNMLFLPTASQDSCDYVEGFNGTFGGRLGCETDALLLWERDRDRATIRSKFDWADGIYVGGGNTKAMIALWRELGVDLLLKRHLDEGKPAGGLSAGALCWFRLGNSDWPIYENVAGVNTAPLECLCFVDLVLCPHTRDEGFRLREFSDMLRASGDFGIGLDDCCALQINGNQYRILASQPNSVAHRIEWTNGRETHSVLHPHEDFRPLEDLRDGTAED